MFTELMKTAIPQNTLCSALMTNKVKVKKKCKKVDTIQNNNNNKEQFRLDRKFN